MEFFVMVDGRPSNLLYQLRRASLHLAGTDVTDGQLLERFLTQRDEVAFEMLVRRHSAMVWGVCRRVLRNHHDAEDAFQATFVVLVRKAAGLRGRGILGNWLYGVAYHTALKARVSLARRQHGEQGMSPHVEKSSFPPEPTDWLHLLDQELRGLPDRYRQAIILCDLEGKSRKDAARVLGWREGTLSGRLARARVLLARRLTRRGVTLSAGTVASALTAQAVARASPALIVRTVQAALSSASPLVAGSALSASVAFLAEGVIRSMFMTKLKIAAIMVLAVSMVGAGAGILHSGVAAGPACQEANKPAKVKPGLVPVQKPARQEQEILAILKRVVNVDYEAVPLRKALEDISNKMGINLVVDRRALQDMGINEERPITLKLENVMLKTALHFMVKDLGLDYTVQEGVLVVGQREHLLTKVIPVGDLIFDREKKNREEVLIRLITQVVEPPTWASMGGNGNIEFFPLGESLVVKQSPVVLEQIEALLAGLRAFNEKAP
jgi:RNA polymerase sigma factor (sigma-70 family)